ncbi:hypothetical protein [Pelagibius litoralis]|nr:hypothetical protein [Pelagibius litoralis]
MHKTANTIAEDFAAADAASRRVSLRCRLAELLLNCARIGFNP